jgi:hypothetical protein
MCVTELGTNGVTVSDVPDMLLEFSISELKPRQMSPYNNPYVDDLRNANRTYYDVAYELIHNPSVNHRFMTIDWKERAYTSLHRAYFKVS